MARTPKRPTQTESPDAESEKTISFEYIKSGLFRVIHADGAIGSVTPTGNLHIAFYSERPAMPQMTVHKHLEDGSLGDPIPEMTRSKDSIVREIDVDIVFSPNVLESLIDFLNKNKEKLTQVVLEEKKKVRRASH